MKLNLSSSTVSAWEQADPCAGLCQPKNKMAEFECQTNHKLCGLCGTKVIYGAHVSAQATSKQAWDVDHIKPQSKGGTNKVNNLQVVHVRCNRNKGDKDQNHFVRFGRI